MENVWIDDGSLYKLQYILGAKKLLGTSATLVVTSALITSSNEKLLETRAFEPHTFADSLEALGADRFALRLEPTLRHLRPNGSCRGHHDRRVHGRSGRYGRYRRYARASVHRVAGCLPCSAPGGRGWRGRWAGGVG